MKLTRHARLAGVVLVGTLALAACGSDDNTTGAASTVSGDGGDCATGTLNAEGSSAQKNAIEEAIASYQEKCTGATINYNPTGSGAGIKQFIAAQVDFAGSDSALKTEAKDGKVEADDAKARCQGNPAWDLPMVAGPIAVAYNLSGVDKLVLSPEVAAKAFLGQITKWNDPAIAALNSGATLPDKEIKVFYRSDESGTTENFAKYLNTAASSVWTEKPAKAWPGKVGEGREKSAGVSEGVKQTDGGLTYVEWSYARDNDLGVAQIDNGGGAVELTAASASKALEVAAPSGEGNDLKLKLDYATKEAGTYPIVLVTYEVVCSKGLDADKTKLVKSFLKHFSSTEVQSGLTDLGYAPLPDSVRTKVVAAVDAIS
ncbi:MAG: phosphate ABC transporter substrate-binding protein PstS [Kineosporiaceae bacterium]